MRHYLMFFQPATFCNYTLTDPLLLFLLLRKAEERFSVSSVPLCSLHFTTQSGAPGRIWEVVMSSDGASVHISHLTRPLEVRNPKQEVLDPSHRPGRGRFTS